MSHFDDFDTSITCEEAYGDALDRAEFEAWVRCRELDDLNFINTLAADAAEEDRADELEAFLDW